MSQHFICVFVFDVQTLGSWSLQTWSDQTDLLLSGKLETASEFHWRLSSVILVPVSGPTQLQTQTHKSTLSQYIYSSTVHKSG